jgi:hypothetical protein
MIERPSQQWQRRVSEAPAGSHASELWPAGFITVVDEALVTFDREIDGLEITDDDAVWAAVGRAVRALNDADEKWHCIETGEREELCEYLDKALTAAGVDVVAFTGRRGLVSGELTDQWREW